MKPKILAALALGTFCAGCGRESATPAGTAHIPDVPAPSNSAANLSAPEPTPIASAPAENSSEPVGGASEHTSYTEDTTHRTTVNALKRELVGAGSVDGEPITDVQLRSRCEISLVTARGTTVIRWSGVGNFARHVEGGVATIPLDDGTGAHAVSLPEGAGSRRVDSGFGLLADECAAR